MTIASLPVGVIRYGPDWRVKQVNASARALLQAPGLVGSRRGDVLALAGASPDIAPPDPAELPCSRYVAVTLPRATRGLLAHYAARDGDVVVTFQPAEWSLGMLEQMHDAVAATDHRGQVVYANEAAERMVGAARGDLIGRRVQDVAELLSIPRRIATAMVDAAREGHAFPEKVAGTRRDGREHSISVLASPWRHLGLICGVLLVAHDLTPSPDPAPELATAIWYRVTAMFQHELRNPLQTIQAAAEMARLRSRERAVRASLDLIEQHVRIVSEYLSEQLEPPRGTPYPLGRLSDVVQAECERAALRLSTRRLAFAHRRPAAEPQVRLHRSSMARVFANIFHNAARARPDATVEIAYALGGDGLTCTVTDNGPGLPPEMRDGGWLGRAGGRAGHLGLAIVASTMEAHDGTVRLDNAPGAGARVTLRLPLGAAGVDGLESGRGDAVAVAAAIDPGGPAAARVLTAPAAGRGGAGTGTGP